jgi:hypothetical protein
MPKIEISGLEIRDDGVLEMSTLPEEARKALQAEFDRAYGKGAAKAADEAKKQLETEIARVRDEARKAGADPSKDEKLKNLEGELSRVKEDQALRDKNFEEAQRLRDERHAKELAEREEKLKVGQTELERRTSVIRKFATSEIRVAASKHGAREESFDELELLLGRRIGLNEETLEAFVSDLTDTTKPALGKDGKPLTIDGLVLEYLADHPHHKAAPAGRGGGATGGRSLAGHQNDKAGEWAGEVEKVAQDPSIANVTSAVAKMREAAAKAS